MPPETHRAVDENPAALRCEVLEHLGNHHRRVNYLAIGIHVELPTTNYQPAQIPCSDSRSASLVRPRLPLQLLGEALGVPDLDVVDASEHANFADNRCALTQVRWNHDATLAVELALPARRS